jgi:hypothetical protein
MAEKHYNELVEIFTRQLPRSFKKSPSSDNSNNESQRKLTLHGTQVELFTRALLLQVSFNI